jgi:hypothetical protein
MSSSFERPNLSPTLIQGMQLIVNAANQKANA